MFSSSALSPDVLFAQKATAIVKSAGYNPKKIDLELFRQLSPIIFSKSYAALYKELLPIQLNDLSTKEEIILVSQLVIDGLIAKTKNTLLNEISGHDIYRGSHKALGILVGVLYTEGQRLWQEKITEIQQTQDSNKSSLQDNRPQKLVAESEIIKLERSAFRNIEKEKFENGQILGVIETEDADVERTRNSEIELEKLKLASRQNISSIELERLMDHISKLEQELQIKNAQLKRRLKKRRKSAKVKPSYDSNGHRSRRDDIRDILKNARELEGTNKGKQSIRKGEMEYVEVYDDDDDDGENGESPRTMRSNLNNNDITSNETLTTEEQIENSVYRNKQHQNAMDYLMVAQYNKMTQKFEKKLDQLDHRKVNSPNHNRPVSAPSARYIIQQQIISQRLYQASLRNIHDGGNTVVSDNTIQVRNNQRSEKTKLSPDGSHYTYHPTTGRRILLSEAERDAKHQKRFRESMGNILQISEMADQTNQRGRQDVNFEIGNANSKGPTVSEWPGKSIGNNAEKWVEKMNKIRNQDVDQETTTVLLPPSISLPVYSQLNNNDLLITIEHCHNCEHHNISTRHDPEEYIQKSDYFLKVIAQIAHDACIAARIGVIRFEADITPKSNINDEDSRIGAFEVQIAYKSGNSNLHSETIHSKLNSRRWPSKTVLEKRFRSFVAKAQIPSYQRPLYMPSGNRDLGCDGVGNYPVGICAWLETELANPMWSFPASAVSRLNRSKKNVENEVIQWVYDCRKEIPPVKSNFKSAIKDIPIQSKTFIKVESPVASSSKTSLQKDSKSSLPSPNIKQSSGNNSHQASLVQEMKSIEKSQHSSNFYITTNPNSTSSFQSNEKIQQSSNFYVTTNPNSTNSFRSEPESYSNIKNDLHGITQTNSSPKLANNRNDSHDNFSLLDIGEEIVVFNIEYSLGKIEKYPLCAVVVDALDSTSTVWIRLKYHDDGLKVDRMKCLPFKYFQELMKRMEDGNSSIFDNDLIEKFKVEYSKSDFSELPQVVEDLIKWVHHNQVSPHWKCMNDNDHEDINHDVNLTKQSCFHQFRNYVWKLLSNNSETSAENDLDWRIQRCYSEEVLDKLFHSYGDSNGLTINISKLCRSITSSSIEISEKHSPSRIEEGAVKHDSVHDSLIVAEPLQDIPTLSPLAQEISDGVDPVIAIQTHTDIALEENYEELFISDQPLQLNTSDDNTYITGTKAEVELELIKPLISSLKIDNLNDIQTYSSPEPSTPLVASPIQSKLNNIVDNDTETIATKISEATTIIPKLKLESTYHRNKSNYDQIKSQQTYLEHLVNPQDIDKLYKKISNFPVNHKESLSPSILDMFQKQFTIPTDTQGTIVSKLDGVDMMAELFISLSEGNDLHKKRLGLRYNPVILLRYDLFEEVLEKFGFHFLFESIHKDAQKFIMNLFENLDANLSPRVIDDGRFMMEEYANDHEFEFHVQDFIECLKLCFKDAEEASAKVVEKAIDDTSVHEAVAKNMEAPRIEAVKEAVKEVVKEEVKIASQEIVPSSSVHPVSAKNSTPAALELEKMKEDLERLSLRYQDKDVKFTTIIIEGESLEHSAYDSVQAHLSITGLNGGNNTQPAKLLVASVCLGREKGSKRRSYMLDWGEILIKADVFREHQCYVSVVIVDKEICIAHPQLPTASNTTFGNSPNIYQIPLYKFMSLTFEVKVTVRVWSIISQKFDNIIITIQGNSHEPKESRTNRIMSMKPADLLNIKFEKLYLEDDGFDEDEEDYTLSEDEEDQVDKLFGLEDDLLMKSPNNKKSVKKLKN